MDVLNDYIGDFGYWQLYIFFVLGSNDMTGAMNTYVMTFYTPNVDFWCARPESAKDVPVDVWINYSSPLIIEQEQERRSRCRVYDWVYDSNVSSAEELMSKFSNKTKRCHQWEFDQGIYERTMRKDFDVVCKRDILISTSNAIYMAGFMIGVFVSGILADRFGRRKVILINQAMCLTITIIMIFPQSFMMFIILRGFQNFAAMGAVTVGFVLFMEVCSDRHRAMLGNLFQWGYTVGMVSFAGIAYQLRNWKHIQMTIASQFTVILFMLCFFPESPRWLVTKGHTEEAYLQIRRIAKFNRIKIQDNHTLKVAIRDAFQNHLEKTKENKRNYTIIHILMEPILRKRTVNLFFCWAVIAFVYYGLSFNTNNLVGDPFINFFAAALVEAPAYVYAAITTKYIGRKYPVAFNLIIGGFACLAPIFISPENKILHMVFPMIGKFFVSATFAIIYVYTTELYPTVVRTSGLGLCSMVGRVGSMTAPFVKELGEYTNMKVPLIVICILSVVSGLLVLLLPETKNVAIPETIEQLVEKPSRSHAEYKTVDSTTV